MKCFSFSFILKRNDHFFPSAVSNVCLWVASTLIRIINHACPCLLCFLWSAKMWSFKLFTFDSFLKHLQDQEHVIFVMCVTILFSVVVSGKGKRWIRKRSEASGVLMLLDTLTAAEFTLNFKYFALKSWIYCFYTRFS